MATAVKAVKTSTIAGGHLLNDDSPIQVQALRLYSRNAFIRLLDTHCAPRPAESVTTVKNGKSSTVSVAAAAVKTALIIDRSLSGPLGLLCEVELLKAHGVHTIYHLASTPVYDNECYNFIYLLRPEPLSQLEHIKTHIDHFKQQEQQQQQQLLQLQQQQGSSAAAAAARPRRSYHLYFVSHVTLLVERMLQQLSLDHGVFSTIHSFDLHLIPLEHDLLSCEQPTFYRDLHARHDISCLHTVATTLMQLQTLYGCIRSVRGRGEVAWQTWQLLQHMESRQQHSYPDTRKRVHDRNQHHSNSNDSSRSELGHIDELLLIDRQIDIITPMLMPHSYEGLIDEVYGIKHSYIEIDAALLGKRGAIKLTPPAAVTATGADAAAAAAAAAAAEEEAAEAAIKANSQGKKKLTLNASDPIFHELRAHPYRSLGPTLHQKAALIADTYAQRHTATTVSAMHAYMQRFKTAHSQHTLLQVHINIAEAIAVWCKQQQYDQHCEIEKRIVSQFDNSNSGNSNDNNITMADVDQYMDCLLTKPQQQLLHQSQQQQQQHQQQHSDANRVLRLMVLLSLTYQLSSKRYEQLKHMCVHAFGYQCVPLLLQLEKEQLLGANVNSARLYSSVRRALRLVNNNYSTATSAAAQSGAAEVVVTDAAAAVFGGYAPITVRLIEQYAIVAAAVKQQSTNSGSHNNNSSSTISNNINNMQLLSQLLPGKVFDVRRDHDGSVLHEDSNISGNTKPPPAANTQQSQQIPVSSAALDSLPSGSSSSSSGKTVTLVYFIGGVTSSEVSALRALSARPDHAHTYIIATTSLITAGRVIDSYREQHSNNSST